MKIFLLIIYKRVISFYLCLSFNLYTVEHTHICIHTYIHTYIDYFLECKIMFINSQNGI